MKPIIYLLCGLGGAGKTTYAHQLTQSGLRKFSLDEYVYNLYGRAITSLPESVYRQRYRTAQAALDKEMVEVIKKGQSAVLDYGFWRRHSRDYYKRLIESSGGQWKLIYLKAEPEVLRERLRARNKRVDANAFPVSGEMLDRYIERFEEPSDEGEEVVVQRLLK